ncbi:hypothetical protein [Mycoplasmopsis columbina]|uniref:Membrane protein n=1 Tax=Mycoplasmopsis columbina SF7 TaxID=1037410 RepID=F9UJY4_9BACT|nr:hypothetical protein [Mycoplasmopsis columbina]EGV00330.1 membrane protein [Mycoplasmopsis columbina SF7]VEU76805.1 Uncharacterised protein [Mycoplasmopsis columbina]
MKKVNVKVKTIVWAFLLIASLIVFGITIAVIVNTNYILSISDYAIIDDSLILQAKTEQSFAIGFLALSIVIFFISTYITYAGIKSWSYNAIL